MKLISTLLVTSLIVLLSCWTKKGNDSTIKQDEKLLKERLQGISVETGSIADFDTLKFKFTYQYQLLKEKNNKLLLNNFKVNDIVKKDSFFVLHLNKYYSPRLYFEIRCDLDQINRMFHDSIINLHRVNFRNKELALLLSINSIQKIQLEVQSDVDYSGDPEIEPATIVELEASNDLLIKGNLLKAYKLK